MTYQGERSRPMASEDGQFFEVSKVRIGADGHCTDVLWCEVSAATNREVGTAVAATAAELVDAIHDGATVTARFAPHGHLPERAFVVVEHEDGRECIALAGAPSPGRNLEDLDRLDALEPAAT